MALTEPSLSTLIHERVAAARAGADRSRRAAAALDPLTHASLQRSLARALAKRGALAERWSDAP